MYVIKYYLIFLIVITKMSGSFELNNSASCCKQKNVISLSELLGSCMDQTFPLFLSLKLREK